MHDTKHIFISFGDFCPYFSSTFKCNTMMIYVTKNGFGLTLGLSGTPQSKYAVFKGFTTQNFLKIFVD